MRGQFWPSREGEILSFDCFLERKHMSTKTTIKRIALVAAVAAAFGGLSTVAANAAANTVTEATVVTSATAATASAPAPQGTAITVNLTATPGDNLATGDTISVAYVLDDPNGNAVKNGTFTAAAANVGTHGVVTQSAAAAGYSTGQTITVTATGGSVTAATLTIGTLSFTPAMGGTYTLHTTTGGSTAAATPTANVGAELGQTGPTDGAFYVSGVNVNQGTTQGNPGTAQTGSQSQVTITLPSTISTGYKIVSSGVGAIVGATGTHVSNVNVSGVTTDFSQGLIGTTDATLSDPKSELLTLTSSASGAQTITVSSINATSGVVTTLYTIIDTWSGATTFSPSASVVRIAGPGAVAGDQGATSASTLTYTTTLDAVPYTSVKTAGTNVATIEALLLNADGSAATQGNTITATVSGSGLITVDTTAGAEAGAKRAQSVPLTAGAQNAAFIHVSADGTAGTGTITVTATDAVSGVTTTLATKTVTFYGAAASLKVAVSNYSIGRAGYTTGGASATRTSALEIGDSTNTTATVTNNLTTTPAFVVEALDSNGTPVNLSNSISVSSSDTTVVTGGSCVLENGTYNATYSDSTNGVGFYNCDFTTAPNAVSGAKATLTVKTLNPADATGTTYLTATYPVSVGGKVAKETLTTDATSYAPGAQMLVTFTATDASGNPVYDGAASPGAVSPSLATGGAAGFAGIYVGGVDASATTLAKSKLYAPSIAGNLVLSATGTDAASTPLSASATVSGGVTDTAASAATDAANEATDAANAATDAANAAADAADAATSAAQDAGAKADAALAAITALDAKITVLAAQIAKIVKKLKA
jgi:trimeric autotransporter adhesin